MNRRIHLYGILILVTVVQIIFMKRTSWFPDLMLLLVVFAGIFYGPSEGIRLGFVAGVLRGSLSIYTLPLDIFLFPLVGAISSILAERFYRQNPVVEISVSAFAMIVVVAFHTFFLKIVSGNEFIGVWSVLRGSLPALLVTIAFSPVFFLFLRGFGVQEE